jgi:hypothetical protein
MFYGIGPWSYLAFVQQKQKDEHPGKFKEWRHDILSAWHFDNLPFCQLDILSTCHFVNLTFCQLDILSTWHFVNLTFCQLAIMATIRMWNYLQWMYVCVCVCARVCEYECECVCVRARVWVCVCVCVPGANFIIKNSRPTRVKHLSCAPI